jgi:cytochrome c-type biogenesis protein CcmE
MTGDEHDPEASASAEERPVVKPLLYRDSREGGRAAEKRRVWLPIVLVAVTVALVALVMTSFKDSTIYSKGIDQLVAEKSKWVGRTVRVEGTLVRGTLKFREKPCEYQFDATRGNATIHVKYASCIKPDTLRDDMPDVGVTAEGKLTENGDFIATNVLAKCPSKYDMKDKAQKGYPGAENGAPPPPPASAGQPGGPPAALP